MGNLIVHPIAHASLVPELADGTIYVDPVCDPSAYAGLPAAAMILITHEHGDHFNAATLAVLDTRASIFIANTAVSDMLTEDQQARATSLANRETMGLGDLTIDAIAAYNITEDRLSFHPEGCDNGYVLTCRDFRVYISDDTEDTPEMRGLENIDLAFVCMNLPFTMDAASAVVEFAPTYV